MKAGHTNQPAPLAEGNDLTMRAVVQDRYGTDPDVVLTVAEVAEMMRVSNMTVYRLVHSGDLPAVRFGRSFRIPESAVVAAIQTPIADVG